MATLTKQEILTQLRKLGIISASEINTFFEEYEEYSTLREVHTCPAQVYYNHPENK
jgi:hypothetical protein